MDKEFEWFLQQFDDTTAMYSVKLLGIRGWLYENQQAAAMILGFTTISS